jgi:hypothetical protein
MFGLAVTFLSAVLAFDGFMAWQIWANRQAEAWPTTEGRIKCFDRSQGGMFKGRAVSVELEYGYEVDGKEFTSSQYRLGIESDTWGIPSFTEGQKVTVWHDPNDPAEAVLTVGPGREDVHLVFAAIPINAVGVLIVCGMWSKVSSRKRAGASRVILRQGDVLIPVSSFTPMGGAALGIVLGSMSGLFATMFLFDPLTMQANYLYLAVVICFSGTIGMVVWFRQRAGHGCIRIDNRARVLQIPKMGMRSSKVFQLESISGVSVRESPRRAVAGRMYQVTVSVRTSESEHFDQVVLCECVGHHRARGLASMIREFL